MNSNLQWWEIHRRSVRWNVTGWRNLGNEPVVAPLAEHEVFTVVGTAGFERLCAAFYRQVPQDDILGPMYPTDDLVGAEQRLRDFLIYRFGGPQNYLTERGHPRLRMRHAPFAIDVAARDRWMQLMTAAMAAAELPSQAIETLEPFFQQMTSFLINRGE